jgi:hypothetical protein
MHSRADTQKINTFPLGKKRRETKTFSEDKWASDILRLTRERAPRPRLSFAVKGGYIGIKFAHPVALSNSLCIKCRARSWYWFLDSFIKHLLAAAREFIALLITLNFLGYRVPRESAVKYTRTCCKFVTPPSGSNVLLEFLYTVGNFRLLIQQPRVLLTKT